MRFQKCIDSILIGSACSFKFVDGLIILESDWARIFLVINPELDYSQTCNFWVLFSFWSISRHSCDFVKKYKNMFFGNFLAIFGLLPKCAFFSRKTELYHCWSPMSLKPHAHYLKKSLMIGFCINTIWVGGTDRMILWYCKDWKIPKWGMVQYSRERNSLQSSFQ